MLQFARLEALQQKKLEAAKATPVLDTALDDRLLKMQFAMFQQLQTSKPVEAPPIFDLEAAIIEIGLAGLSEDCLPCS